MNLAAITFDLDPILVSLGPVRIHYYGVVFAATLAVAYFFWRWQMRRGGQSSALIDRFVLWGVLATVVGARLGHYLFYEPDKLIEDPLSLLYVWQGGLASHGATIGLVLTLIIFAIRNRLNVMDTLDRFTFSAAVGAAGIRLGNFLNSEIVGRPTDVPWAVIFTRYHPMPDAPVVPRHPSQLYEFALGLLVLLTLVLVDRLAGREKRPRGLLMGVFFSLYFGGRCIVEFFKEYQTSLESQTILTMGQMLSIIPFFIGLGLLAWSFRKAPAPAALPQPAAARPKKKRAKS